MKLEISVIGAGVAGLASAIRMAVRGHKVSVYEQSDGPGGKMGNLVWKDYRWDTGPSLLTLPELLEELYLMADDEMKVFIRMNQLEVITRYFYEDGMKISAFGDPKEFAREVSNKTGEKENKVTKHLSRARTAFNLTKDVFIFNSFRLPAQLKSRAFRRALIRIGKLNVFRSMHSENKRMFSSEHLVQLFDRYATYNGSNPYKAPATLNVIAHLEHSLGAFFPEKGIYCIADELYKLALKLGVEIHFNSKVEKVKMKDGRIHALQVQDREIRTDLMISDVDIYHFYKDLLPSYPFPAKYFKQERSTSALIFYWAIDREFPELELHNILFSKDYKEEFNFLFNRKTIFDDPTVYIYISSKHSNDDAPEGGENWFVMINSPENIGQDWDRELAQARESIIEKISRMLNVNIEKHIVHEHIATPETIEETTSSFRGSLYGNSSNSKFAAFNRHPNYRKELEGVYFVGGSVHPGGGIPLCLSSARIVDGMIYEHYF